MMDSHLRSRKLDIRMASLTPNQRTSMLALTRQSGGGWGGVGRAASNIFGLCALFAVLWFTYVLVMSGGQ